MSVVGRRALYKEAQDRFTRWLTATAASRRQSMAPKKTPVPVKDLKACADLIIAWKPPIDIDSNMLELLEDVIIGRKLASAFFAERGLQDEGHIRMIESLIDIHTKLREERRARARARSNQRVKRIQREESNGDKNLQPELEPENKFPSREEDVLANMSEILQIEEIDLDSSTRAPSKKADKVAQATSMTIEVNEAEEARFALFCALQDMSQLRRKVKEIWFQHREGKVSASAAAVVSETAFALMKRTDDDLVATHPQFRCYSDVLKSVGLVQCFDATGRIPWIGRMSNDTGVVRESEDMSALFCSMAGAMINDFMNRWGRIEQNAVLRLQAGDEGDIWAYEHPPDTERRYSFHPFAQVFYETFPDIWRLAYQSIHHIETRLQTPDMIGGLAQAGLTRETRFWLISATQSNFDACDALGSFEGRSDVLWHMRAHRSALMSKKYTDFCARHFIDDGMSETLLLRVQKHLNGDLSITNALVQDQTSCDVVTLGNKDSWQPLDAFRRFPLLAGGNLDSLQAVMHRYGIFVANTGQIIVAIAYLYLALKHSGCLSHGWTWPDMDWFLKEHNGDNHLVKDPGPRADMSRFLRHFLLTLGYSAASLTRCTRSSRPIMTKPVPVQTGSEYLQGMAEHSKTSVSVGLSKRDPNVTALHKLVAARRSSSKRSNQGDSMKLSATDLLDEYTAMRLRDEPAFNFDYLSFWMVCAELVYKLCVATEEVFGQCIYAIPRNGVDATVVGDILMDASKHEAHGGSLKTSILGDAGKILQSHIGKNGDRLSKEATELARGEIPVSWSGRCCLYTGGEGETEQSEGNPKVEGELQREAAADHRGKGDTRKFQATVEDCPFDEE